VLELIHFDIKFALVVPHCGEGSSLVFDIGVPEGAAGVIQEC